MILAIDNCGFQSNPAFEFQLATRKDRLSKENNNFEILRLLTLISWDGLGTSWRQETTQKWRRSQWW